jgi:hypothetical protein
LRESYRSLNQSLKFFDCNFRCEPRADDSELDRVFFTNAAHLIQNIQLSIINRSEMPTPSTILAPVAITSAAAAAAAAATLSQLTLIIISAR